MKENIKFNIDLNINRSVFIAIFILTLVSINLMHLGGNYLRLNNNSDIAYYIYQLFDLDTENNIPTYISSLLMLSSCLVSLSLYQREKNRGHLLFSGILFFFSVDEVAGIHETIHSLINFHWVFLGVSGIIIIVLLFKNDLMSLDRKYLANYTTGFSIFFLGSIFTEYLSRNLIEDSYLYVISVMIEESFEFIGIFIIILTNSDSDT